MYLIWYFQPPPSEKRDQRLKEQVLLARDNPEKLTDSAIEKLGKYQEKWPY